jgi:TPR repeat protein
MKRGQGHGRGPIEYLLGKDYKRKDASLLRGDPELTRDLIDSSNFSKRYTSGVLSFAEEDIPDHLKSELMNDFERTILAGLEHDQYNVLWVQHKDKNRLELNFVIVNTELRSGKRLQPYFRQADFHLVNNWQNFINARHGFSDPNDPSKKRLLTTASDISKSRAEAVEQISAGLTELVKSGAVNDRADVLNALKMSGFTIARETKQSISIADPNGSKNIRLKGAIYERSFNASQLDAEQIEAAGASYRESAAERAERAKAALEQSVAIKRESNIKRYSSKPERVTRADRRNAVTDESSRDSNVAPDRHDRADSPSRSVFSHGLAEQTDSNERTDNQQPESAINTVKSERERTEMRQQNVRADRHDSARVRERLQSHSGEGEELNDRARAEANACVRESDSFLQKAAAGFKRAAGAVSKAAAGAASALSSLGATLRGSDDTERADRHAVSALERACEQFLRKGAVNVKANDEMSAQGAYDSVKGMNR